MRRSARRQEMALQYLLDDTDAQQIGDVIQDAELMARVISSDDVTMQSTDSASAVQPNSLGAESSSSNSAHQRTPASNATRQNTCDYSGEKADPQKATSIRNSPDAQKQNSDVRTTPTVTLNTKDETQKKRAPNATGDPKEQNADVDDETSERSVKQMKKKMKRRTGLSAAWEYLKMFESQFKNNADAGVNEVKEQDTRPKPDEPEVKSRESESQETPVGIPSKDTVENVEESLEDIGDKLDEETQEQKKTELRKVKMLIQDAVVVLGAGGDWKIQRAETKNVTEVEVCSDEEINAETPCDTRDEGAKPMEQAQSNNPDLVDQNSTQSTKNLGNIFEIFEDTDSNDSGMKEQGTSAKSDELGTKTRESEREAGK